MPRSATHQRSVFSRRLIPQGFSRAPLVPMVNRARQAPLPDPNPTEENLATLAGRLHDEGNLAAAQPIYESVLAVEEAAPDSTPDTAATLNNFADLLRDKGDLAQALLLYKRALKIFEETLGHDHPETASVIVHLAGLFQEKGDLDLALPLYESGLEIFERTLEPEDTNTAALLNDFANLLQRRGDIKRAAPMYRRALHIWETKTGPEHVHLATTLNNYARLLQEGKSNFVETETAYRRALAIRQRILGDEHPETADILNSLASFLSDRRRFAEAQSLYQEAIEILEKTLGPENPQVATTTNNLADLHSKQGDFAKAAALYKRALEIHKAYDPEHRNTAKILYNFADFYFEQEKFDLARPLFEEALAIRVKILDRGDDDIFRTINVLALLYLKVGDNEAARKMLDFGSQLIGEAPNDNGLIEDESSVDAGEDPSFAISRDPTIMPSPGSRGLGSRNNTGDQTEGNLPNAKGAPPNLEEGVVALKHLLAAFTGSDVIDDEILSQTALLLAKRLIRDRPLWDDRKSHRSLRHLKLPGFLREVYRDLNEGGPLLPDGRAIWHLVLPTGIPVWQEAIRDHDARVVQILQGYVSKLSESDRKEIEDLIFLNKIDRGAPKRPPKAKGGVKSRRAAPR